MPSVYFYVKKRGDGYIVTRSLAYYSLRYKKSVTVKEGTVSDGATFYPDIDSIFWLVHDELKTSRKWGDLTHCRNIHASLVAYDILMAEKRYLSAVLVFSGTLVWGYGRRLIDNIVDKVRFLWH